MHELGAVPEVVKQKRLHGLQALHGLSFNDDCVAAREQLFPLGDGVHDAVRYFFGVGHGAGRLVEVVVGVLRHVHAFKVGGSILVSTTVHLVRLDDG